MAIPGITSGIGGIGSIASGATSAARGASAGGEAGGFQQMLSGLQNSQGQADKALNDLSVGSETDLHDSVLAVETESLSFDLAVQVRNRLIDAYQEMFRMSV